jgi:hypothetical protein
MRATPIVAVVPQEDPVARLINEQTITVAGKKIDGESIFKPKIISVGIIPDTIQLPVKAPTIRRIIIAFVLS